MINISKEDSSSFAGTLNPRTTSKPNSSNVNCNLAPEYHSASLVLESFEAIASALLADNVNLSVNTSPNQTECFLAETLAAARLGPFLGP